MERSPLFSWSVPCDAVNSVSAHSIRWVSALAALSAGYASHSNGCENNSNAEDHGWMPHRRNIVTVTATKISLKDAVNRTNTADGSGPRARIGFIPGGSTYCTRPHPRSSVGWSKECVLRSKSETSPTFDRATCAPCQYIIAYPMHAPIF